MKQPQAVIFDVDGTLFDYHNRCIPASTMEAVNRLHAQNIPVIIATGRSYGLLCSELRNAIRPDYYVVANGQAVLDGHGTVLRANRFSTKQTLSVLEICRAKEVPFLLNMPQRSYAYEGYEQMQVVIGNIGRLDDNCMVDCPAGDCHLQELPCGFTVNGSTALAAEITAVDSSLLADIFHDTVGFDLFLAGNSKMTALHYLMSRLDLSSANCIAFGDSSNDLAMVEGVGMGIAMGNACDSLKQVANRVCQPSWQDGIFTALKELQII